MTDTNSTWNQVSDRLEALALKLKLKLHLEQSSDGTLPEAPNQLRHGVKDAFEAAGNAVKDDAVCADVREVGNLLADAVSKTLNKVSDEVHDAAKRK